MSEFSESFHLVASDADHGAGLLRAAGVAGWVFPPSGGWVTVVADAEFMDAPADALLGATEGLVIHYVNAEDHGWSFRAAGAAGEVARYEAGWDDEIEIDDSRLDLDRLVAALAEAGVPVDAAELAATLAEPSEEALMDPGTNPGHRFARLLGWGEYEWLSGSYARADGGADGAVRIEG